MDTVAIIVAAGRGLRAASDATDLPKQYRPLGGAPILARSLAAFAAHKRVSAVITVIHRDDEARYRAAAEPFAARLLPPVHGGRTRQESVRAGLSALRSASPRSVLIHDAARPFVPSQVIDRVICALDTHTAAIPACPVSDTLKRAEGDRIVGTVERGGLWRAQTPQGFRYRDILAAHDAAAAAHQDAFTDDAAVAQWHGLDVTLVEGAESNRKLTTTEDFDLAERLLRAGQGRLPESRTGQGFDVHAFTDGDHVMLCGVRVPHERGLAGHSDADVGLHALTDAILGAIGDGDIGAHFPPSDPQWRGAASDLFLRDAARRVAARGASIVNVDVTLICQTPRIGPHRDAMRARIAEILGIAIDRVSVKATTTEGLGFTGRKEGIAATATATVRLP